MRRLCSLWDRHHFQMAGGAVTHRAAESARECEAASPNRQASSDYHLLALTLGDRAFSRTRYARASRVSRSMICRSNPRATRTEGEEIDACACQPSADQLGARCIAETAGGSRADTESS